MPYPPSTRVDHFDHEANIARVASLEARLTANQHSIFLLRAQLKEEEKLAREDEAEVEHLERSLKSNQAFRRQQARTLHVVAKEYLDSTQMGVENQYRTVRGVEQEKMSPSASVNELVKDEDLKPTLDQLRSHLQSIQSNVTSVSRLKATIDVAWRDLLGASVDTSMRTGMTTERSRMTISDQIWHKEDGIASTRKERGALVSAPGPEYRADLSN